MGDRELQPQAAGSAAVLPYDECVLEGLDASCTLGGPGRPQIRGLPAEGPCGLRVELYTPVSLDKVSLPRACALTLTPNSVCGAVDSVHVPLFPAKRAETPVVHG